MDRATMLEMIARADGKSRRLVVRMLRAYSTTKQTIPITPSSSLNANVVQVGDERSAIGLSPRR